MTPAQLARCKWIARNSIVGGDMKALLDHCDEMGAVLTMAREKLELYRKAHSGEYIGGCEYSSLIKMIDTALAVDTEVKRGD